MGMESQDLGTVKPSSSTLRKILKIIFLIPLIATIVFLVFTFIFSIPIGMGLFYFTPDGISAGQRALSYLPFYVLPMVEASIPIQLRLSTVFLYLELIYAACLFFAWKGPKESFTKVIKNSYSSTKQLLNNCLFALPIYASMGLVAVYFLTIFQESHGVPTGSLPQFDPLLELFFYTYAAVVEEIGFRIIPLGLFILFYLFWVRRVQVGSISLTERLKLLVETVLYPEGVKRKLGLKNVEANGLSGISSAEWVAMAVMAGIFGLSHYLSGSGWGPGKISSAAIVGFIFGLAYIMYGIEAPIILHFFFNYYTTVYELAYNVYPGMFGIFLDFSYTLIVLLGLIGWLALFIFTLGKIAHRIFRVRREMYPASAPVT